MREGAGRTVPPLHARAHKMPAAASVEVTVGRRERGRPRGGKHLTNDPSQQDECCADAPLSPGKVNGASAHPWASRTPFDGGCAFTPRQLPGPVGGWHPGTPATSSGRTPRPLQPQCHVARVAAKGNGRVNGNQAPAWPPRAAHRRRVPGGFSLAGVSRGPKFPETLSSAAMR